MDKFVSVSILLGDEPGKFKGMSRGFSTEKGL